MMRKIQLIISKLRRFPVIICTLLLMIFIELCIMPYMLIETAYARSSTQSRLASLGRALDNFDETMLKIKLANWALKYPNVAVAFALTGAKYKYMSDVDLYSKYDLQQDAQIIFQMAQRNPQAIRELLDIVGEAVRNAYETRLTEAQKEQLQALLDGEDLKPTIVEGANCRVKQVKFYEGGREGVSFEKRKYQNSFSVSQVRYIYPEIDYTNKNYQKQNVIIPYTVQYFDATNKFLAEDKGFAEPKANWSSCILAAGGIGFDESSLWPIGSYTAKIWLDNVYVGEYRFQINPN